MANDINEDNRTSEQTNDGKSDVRITLSESSEEAFRDPNQPTAKRRNSIKSIKSLHKNKVFPQKLPPIRKSKISKKMVKMKSVRIAEPTIEVFKVKWTNLSYIVERKENPWLLTSRFPTYRVILKCLNGSFKSSQLTAIMGPSGAGKSTLLACVCGRRTKGVTGDIVVIGCNRIKVAIISQDDFLTDKFTLREALLFASKAKNGNKDVDHEEVVNNVVNSLSLESILETRLEKCSGGERRRISIALELVSNPNILILDEPTSGLDSSSCYQIVEILRELTQHKKTPMAIVCTIHQPSAKVFNLFHSIYVLSHNGQNIYHGPPGNLVGHLFQLSFSVPEYHNPADYIAEIASAEHGEESITKLATNRKQSAQSETTDSANGSAHKLSKMAHKYNYPAFYHLFILYVRSFKLTIREPHLSWIRLITSIVIGLFVGDIFGYDLGPVAGCPPRLETLYTSKPTELFKDFEREHIAITQNLGIIFFNVVYLMFAGIMPMIMVFPKEFNVITKQYTNGWYSSFTYYLSKFFTDLPITILATTIYVTFWYVLSAQVLEWWRYGVVLGIGILTMIIGVSQGMICSALFPRDPVSAGYLGLISSMPFTLLSGFFVRSKRIPYYLLPINSLSYTKYTFEAAVIAIYGYERCAYTQTNQTLSPPSWLKFLSAMTSSLKDSIRNDDTDLDNLEDPPTAEDSFNDILSMFSGTKVDINMNDRQSMVLSEFEFTDDMLIYNIVILSGFALGFQAMAYLILVYKLKKNV